MDLVFLGGGEDTLEVLFGKKLEFSVLYATGIG